MLGEEFQRTYIIEQVDVCVEMVCGHVEADEVVAVDFPFFIADNGVERHETQPDGGAVGHRGHKTEAVAGFPFEVLLFEQQGEAVGIEVAFCFGMGELVECAGAVVHCSFIEKVCPFLMQA